MLGRALMWNAATVLLFLAGCNRRESGGVIAEPYLADEASVPFELIPLQSGNSQQWLGTYASKGKVAKFRIEFGQAESSSVETMKDLKIKSGEGRFVPEAGSDSSVLLADLRKALQAKIQAHPAATRTIVPFTFATIGENWSQAKGGGFNAQPAGNWIAIKLFLGEGEQEGEVFLNINPKIRKAEFSMKDSDYGDLVLAELAKVL